VKLKRIQDYEAWSQKSAVEREQQKEIELSLLPLRPRSFSIRGRCALCGLETTFRANFDYSEKGANGRLEPNLRECLECAHCGLKNRLRAALHLFVQEFGPEAGQSIYITEQLGAAYRWLKGRYPAVLGSEFIPESGPFGSSPRGIRNEDLGALTWPNDCFDFILSFDVLEHVADVNTCFSEIFRCLRQGGRFLFTAQFRLDLQETVVRATADSSGNITHLMEPEYHGGNLSDSSKGTLCFRHFGWDTIRQLESAGFSDAEAWLFWSRELGYLGGTQIAIAACKKQLVD
jgi:SAM-dependent methyltransferase